MKTRLHVMTRASLLPLLVLASFALSNWAEAQGRPNINFKPDGNTLKVYGSGFKGGKNYQVNFYINDKYKFNDQVVSGSFSADVWNYRKGDRIRVSVLNYYGPGKHHEEEYRGGGGGGNPHPSPPQGWNGDIRNYANQQARTVANRVVATYVQREIWRHSFVKGFLQGKESGAVLGSSHYHSGLDEGRRQGEREGLGAGANQARGEAATRAKEMVEARFRGAVGKNLTVSQLDLERPVDFEFTTPPGNFTGTVVVDSAIQEELKRLDREFQDELRRLRWQDGGFMLTYDSWEHRWHLYEIYGYSLLRFPWWERWAQGSFAYDEWVNNRLGGGYDYNPYQKMTLNQQSAFRSAFYSIYEDAIRDKYFNVRDQIDREALGRGAYYGQIIVAKEAFLKGKAKGYQETYASEYQRAYRDTYHHVFRQSWDEAVDYFSNNAVIVVESVRLFETDGKPFLEPGDKLDLVVERVLNIGGVGASSLSPVVKGEGIETLSTSSDFDLPALSSNSQPIRFERVAYIRPTAETDKSYNVTATLGNAVVGLVLSMSWMDTLTRLKTAKDAELNQLRSMIVREILKEFETVVEKPYFYKDAKNRNTNWYKHGRPDGTKTKLEQLVDFSKTADAATQGVIAEIGRTIEAGDQSSKWSNPWIAGRFRTLYRQLF